MSSSDYIRKKRYDAMHNVFTSKDSSNLTAQLTINTIRDTITTDDYGEVLDPQWFEVQMNPQPLCDISGAIIASCIETIPYMIEPPKMTIYPAVKTKPEPNFMGGDFPKELQIYYGDGPLIYGQHLFVSCKVCGADIFPVPCMSTPNTCKNCG
jgi:hypothetical protein